MKLIIDRIEGSMIVAELPDKSMADLPRAVCPEAKEGDVIEIRVLDDETEKRRARINQKMENLFK